MNETFLLFVYGQLCRGQIGYRSLELDRHTVLIGPAQVSGRLYHLGDYPGLVSGPCGIVHGELLAFEDAALWNRLDTYELYEPERVTASEYRRIEVNLLGSGQRAFAYEYNRPVDNRPVIASGSWWGQ